MYVLNKTDECNDFNNCLKNENDGYIIIKKHSFLSNPSSILLLCLISLRMWTFFKPSKFIKGS